MAVFEVHLSKPTGYVNWFFNDQPVDFKNKRFMITCLDHVRKLGVRKCLKSETDYTVKCKWRDLETESKLTVTGIKNFFLILI